VQQHHRLENTCLHLLPLKLVDIPGNLALRCRMEPALPPLVGHPLRGRLSDCLAEGRQPFPDKLYFLFYNGCLPNQPVVKLHLLRQVFRHKHPLALDSGGGSLLYTLSAVHLATSNSDHQFCGLEGSSLLHWHFSQQGTAAVGALEQLGLAGLGEADHCPNQPTACLNVIAQRQHSYTAFENFLAYLNCDLTRLLHFGQTDEVAQSDRASGLHFEDRGLAAVDETEFARLNSYRIREGEA
jgi:hypothetical protein